MSLWFRNYIHGDILFYDKRAYSSAYSTCKFNFIIFLFYFCLTLTVIEYFCFNEQTSINSNSVEVCYLELRAVHAVLVSSISWYFYYYLGGLIFFNGNRIRFNSNPDKREGHLTFRRKRVFLPPKHIFFKRGKNRIFFLFCS